MTEENQEPAVPPEPLSQMEVILRNYEAHPGIATRLKDFKIAELRTVQYFSILYDLFQGANLLVSAPTSSGKTLVGEMACVHAILEGKGRCLYMVPLKSLANEKLQDFQDRWNALGVQVEMSTGDMTRIDREKEQEKLDFVQLLITTYERADSILRSDFPWFEGVRVVVIDEVHNVGMDARGARLEGLILRLRHFYPTIQFIYLSATIGNPETLAVWLQAQPIIHDHRPVPLEYQIPITANREEKVKEIVVETLRQKGSLLIFVPTRNEAQQLCFEISNFLKERDLLYLLEERSRELRVRVNGFRDRIRAGFDQRLYFPMQRGVAFHHAGLSYAMRVFIETLFREGLVKVIACTPTLSSGINLPAKVVIIKDVGLTQSRKPLDINMFHQMCGRAGRPGFDDWGRAYALARCEAEQSDIRVMYFRPHSLVPKYAPVESQFMQQANLLEQYLVWIVEDGLRKLREVQRAKEQKRRIKVDFGLTEDELEQRTLKTFWYALQLGRYPDTTLNHMVQIGHYTLENLLIRHSTAGAVEEARAIPDHAVTIRQMDAYKLEGIINDRMLVKASFSRDSPDCGCGTFDFHKRLTAPLCPHLIKLAQVAYKVNPSYTKDLLLSALHEEQLVDKLLHYEMVKVSNQRLAATPFGYQTVLLYLSPALAYWIRLQLPHIEAQEKFEQDLLYAYDKEQGGRMKAQLVKVLKRLLREPAPPRTRQNYFYNLQRITESENVPFGDLEEFLEAMRWLSYAFGKLADLDGRTLARSFAEEALLRLVPPPEETAPTGEVPDPESTLSPPSDAGVLGSPEKRSQGDDNK